MVSWTVCVKCLILPEVVLLLCEFEWLVLVKLHMEVFSVENDINIIKCIY